MSLAAWNLLDRGTQLTLIRLYGTDALAGLDMATNPFSNPIWLTVADEVMFDRAVKAGDMSIYEDWRAFLAANLNPDDLDAAYAAQGKDTTVDSPIFYWVQVAGIYGMGGWDGLSDEIRAVGGRGPRMFGGGGGTRAAGTSRPANLSPAGAGRNGAWRAAKRDAGIPVGTQPVATGRLANGSIEYDFEVPTSHHGGTTRVTIREDPLGHVFPDDPFQNRGPHFNSPNGGHFEY